MTAPRPTRQAWLGLISPVLLLVAWETASASGLLREAFFPRPSRLAGSTVRLLLDGTLAHHASVTLARVGWTFLLAAAPGIAVGLAMGVSRRFRDGVDPLFAVVYPIPSVLFLPLISFVVVSPEPALVLTAAITSFFLVAYTTQTGVQQLDSAVVEAATHYGARGWRFFSRVVLPGTLPFVFTGLRLGLGFALIVVIAIEMASAQQGLGAMLWLSWEILKVEEMYVALVVIAVLGGLLTWGLAVVRARLLPWVEDVADRGC